MEIESNKINVDDIRVEKIDQRHSEIIKKFQSSNNELEKFLVEDAIKNKDIDINTTYLFFYNPGNNLVGYVTICSDSIKIRGTQLGNSFNNKGIVYSSLPAMKICRLSVDKRFERKGVGSILIYYSMKKLLQIDEKVSCRFITVDAKRESIHFYKKLGFEILKEQKGDTLSMFFDMIKQIKILREGKKKLNKLGD